MAIPVVKQINDLAWYLHRRREEKWLKHYAEKWGRKRTAGRKQFILRYAFVWGIGMAVLQEVMRFLFERHFSLIHVIVPLPMWLGAGWWTAASIWNDNEKLYQRAQNAAGAGVESRLQTETR